MIALRNRSPAHPVMMAKMGRECVEIPDCCWADSRTRYPLDQAFERVPTGEKARQLLDPWLCGVELQCFRV